MVDEYVVGDIVLDHSLVIVIPSRTLRTFIQVTCYYQLED